MKLFLVVCFIAAVSIESKRIKESQFNLPANFKSIKSSQLVPEFRAAINSDDIQTALKNDASQGRFFKKLLFGSLFSSQSSGTQVIPIIITTGSTGTTSPTTTTQTLTGTGTFTATPITRSEDIGKNEDQQEEIDEEEVFDNGEFILDGGNGKQVMLNNNRKKNNKNNKQIVGIVVPQKYQKYFANNPDLLSNALNSNQAYRIVMPNMNNASNRRNGNGKRKNRFTQN